MKVNLYIRLFLLFLIITSGIENVSAQSEAEFMKVHKEFILRSSGAMEARYTKELKILTHRALNNMYGETFIVYDPRCQEIKFHKAYTRQVDGTIVEVPANAYNEVLPSAAANAPAYNYLREMVVTHTGLELGATIFLDYSVISKPGYYNFLDITESLQELSPINEYRITVKVPSGTKVNYSVTGITETKKESKSRNQDIYTWTFLDIPADSREMYQPTIAGFTPYFTLNTYDSQEKVFSFIHYSQNAPIEAIKKLDHVSTTNATEYIDAVRNYVIKDLDYNRLSVWECGRHARYLQDVCKTGYGTALEKAVLMKALLDNANVVSEVAILYPKGLSKNVYGLTAIKNVGVITVYNNEKVLIACDANQLFTLAELNNRYDIFSVLNNTKVEVSDVKNTVTTQQNSIIELVGDSLKRKATYQLSDVLRGKMLDKPETDYTYSDVINWSEYGYCKVTLKEDIAGINDFYLAKLLSQRSSSFELPYTTNDKVVHEIILPQGVECKTMPQQISLSNTAGQLLVSLTTSGSKIIVNKELRLSKNLFTPAEYLELKELISGWYNPNVNAIILYKGR